MPFPMSQLPSHHLCHGAVFEIEESNPFPFLSENRGKDKN